MKYITTDKHPELKQELQSNWDQWNAKMLPPRWEDSRWDRQLSVSL